VLAVTNTGAVIPPTEINRLFQPFQRLDRHRTHHKDGHGLGLSIVRAIAGAHRVTITAHPEPEGGLRVEVTFPPPIDTDHAVRHDSGAHYARQLSTQDARGASKPDSRPKSSAVGRPEA
jgi:K+-sensing histidine kinase KdpD